MYLIFASNNTAKHLASELNKFAINSISIPCVELSADQEAIQCLVSNINTYDYVIFTSLEAITLSDTAIRQASLPVTFIAAGEQTAIAIRKLTANNTILYPKLNAGGIAIIDEVLKRLDLTNRKFLVVRGEYAKIEIQNYLQASNIKYDELIIYKQEYLEPDAIFLKNLLLNHKLQGIIITSSNLAQHLIRNSLQNSYFELLQKQPFYTLHSNIKDKLEQLGILNVYISSESSIDAIIKRIRSIHE